MLFSGAQQGVITNDTWTFDGSTWQLRSPATSPPARYGHALAYDPVRSRVVMFGGAGLTATGLDDTWEWDGTNWSQRPMYGPDARCLGPLAYDEASGTVVLVGGATTCSGTPSPLDDPWVYRWDGTWWTGSLLDVRPEARVGDGGGLD